ncbi:MAG TPA: GntR family transcriptional regulator, partial [Ktedonobacterales bacterium]|nr:GntR family transcriptional regulator [Ktedonobacterales bacterium]
LYKKRGLGMYVAPGARARLLEKRREQFFEQYVVTMLQEAEKLGITPEQVMEMIQRRVKVR